MDNNLQKLHKSLQGKDSGFTRTYDEFVSDMQDEEKRKRLHASLGKLDSGFTRTYDEFVGDMGFSAPSPASVSPAFAGVKAGSLEAAQSVPPPSPVAKQEPPSPQSITTPEVPLNAAQEQTGFWKTTVGDVLEKLGAGTVRTGAGLMRMIEKLNAGSRIPLGMGGDYIPESVMQESTEGNYQAQDLNVGGAMMEAAERIGERGDRHGLMVDPETGEARKVQYSDLFKQGKIWSGLGEIMLTATESAPTSALAMTPGGLPLIVLSATGQKYHELDSNPDTEDMPEWQKLFNASVSGSLEGLTEKLGAKIDKKMIEPFLKKMTEDTVKGILKKGGVNALIQTITEGAEEVVSKLGENAIDAATGVSDGYKPLEGVLDAFVYGAGGGAQFGGVTAGAAAGRAGQKAIDDRNVKQVGDVVAKAEEQLQKNEIVLEKIVNPQLSADIDPFDDSAVAGATVGTVKAREAVDALISETGVNLDPGIVDLPEEGQKQIVVEILRAENLTDEQKTAIINYISAASIERQLRTAREEQLNEELQTIEAELTKNINPKTGTLVTATLAGSKQPVQVIGGLAVNFDETNRDRPYTPDMDNSDEAVYYIDEEGKTQVTTADQLEVESSQSLFERMQAESLEIQKRENASQFAIDAAVQEALQSGMMPGSEETPASEQPSENWFVGQTVEHPDGSIAQVMQLNSDGSILLEIENADGEISEQLVQPGEMGNFGFPVPEMPENVPEIGDNMPENGNNLTEDGNIVTENGNITPEASNLPGETEISPEVAERDAFMQSLPVVESGKDAGKIDQSRMTSEQTLRYFEYTYGKDRTLAAAVQQVSNLRKQLQKEQAKLDNNPFDISQNEKVAAIEEELRTFSTYADNARMAGIEQQMQRQAEQPTSVAADRQARAEEIAAEEAGRTGTAAPTIAEKWEAAPKVEGMEDVITLANGEKIPGRYVLVPAAAPSPSHDVERNFAMTEGFPVNEQGRTVNDRDYSADQTAQLLVQQRANNYDERAVQSPVVVSSEGIVLSGNDRTMAGQIAARNGSDGAYVDYITRMATRWGFTPEQVSTVPNPRIVFVPDAALPYNTATFAKFNAEEKKTQNSLETAIKASKSISRDAIIPLSQAIEQFEKLNDFYTNPVAVKQAVQVMLRQGIIQPNEVPRLMDGETLSTEGRSFLETLMLGSVLKEEALREIDKMRAARQTLMRSMPQLLRNASLSDYSLIEELNNAIHLLYEAKQSGNRVKLQLRQGNLFEASAEEIYSETEKLLSLMLEGERDSDFRAIFDTYNNKAVAIEAGQSDLFEGILSKPDLLQKILNNYGQQTESNQQAGSPPAVDPRSTEPGTESGEPTGTTEPATATDGTTAGEQPAAESADEGESGRINETTVPESTAPAFSGSILDLANKVVKDAEIEQEAGKVDVNPTEGQKEAGNYKMGHINVQGFDITIENPAGSIRSGKDASGKEWSIEMKNHYGYFKRTEGKDGDHIDVFIGENPASEKVFVIDQVKPTETKTIQDILRLEGDGRRYLSGLVFSTLHEVGDFIRVGNKTYTVSRLTKTKQREAKEGKHKGEIIYDKKITLKDDDGKVYSATIVTTKDGEYNSFHGEGAWGSITRDVEGDIARSMLSSRVKTDSYTSLKQALDLINQNNKPEFDESKVMLGFDSAEEAQEAYLSNYEEGWQGLGAITETNVDKFKTWLYDGAKQRKPFSEYKENQPAHPSKEEYESFDTRGYSYAIEKDGTVLTSGSNPLLGKELMPIKRWLDEAEGYGGDLYIAPTDLNDTQKFDNDFNILGLSWEQVQEKQARKGISQSVKASMPNNATIYPKYEDLFPETKKTSEKPPETVSPIQKSESPSIVKKIEDFGEKIGGARKDLAQEYRKKLSDIQESDILDKPLSKIFPRPNFKELVSSGALSVDNALFLNMLYNSIPAKPRVEYRLSRWAKTVNEALETYKGVLENGDSRNYLDGLREYTIKKNSLSTFFKNNKPYQLSDEQKLWIDDKWLGVQALKELGFPSDATSLKGAEIKYLVSSENNYFRVTLGNKRSTFETFGEVVDYLKSELSNPQKKETVFNVYGYRNKSGYFVGKSVQGKEPIQLSEVFETGKEALAYLRDHRAEIQTKWDAMNVKPEERRTENRDRRGRDWRNGKDISPSQFQETFGFRGTEFGNWVNQSERQDALNNAYDALMDLSTLLNLSPSALSLNGELGMAFGARGTGNLGGSAASAHYEPVKVVINLTKNRGAGSLAHEWWHALDNYFSRTGNDSMSFATYGAQKLDIREEMKIAFEAVMQNIRDSKLPERSKILDATRSKPYWSSSIEMSARAFENYVSSKLAEQGDSNDYLVNFKDLGEWVSTGLFDNDTYPYPTNEETPNVNEKFDQFFNTIQEKEENGRQVLFRSNDYQSREAYAIREWNRAKNAVTEIAKKLGVEIDIIETTEGLTGKKATAKGWYDTKTGKIAIVMPNHKNAWDVQATLLHEAAGHHGLRELFGEHFDTFLENVYDNATGNIQEAISSIMQEEGIDQRTATEEYLSWLAEDRTLLDGEGVSSFLGRVKQFFLDMLAKVGIELNIQLSDNELRYILWRSYQNLANPGRYRNIVDHANNVVMQSKLKVGDFAESEFPMKEVAENGENYQENTDPRYRTVSPIGFYSTVEDALDKIQQEKGTKEQFKAMLLKNGAKQAEMDWMGFEELPDKLTKSEIQEWIGRNRIEVEEVKKEVIEPLSEDELTERRQDIEIDADIKTREEFGVYEPIELWDSYYIGSADEEALNKIANERGFDDYDTLLNAMDMYYENLVNTEIEKLQGGDGTKYSDYVLPDGEEYKELLLTMPTNEGEKEFTTGHYPDSNILAHVRINERYVDDQKILFIEEIQSDWAQKGRKKGFRAWHRYNNRLSRKYGLNSMSMFSPKVETVATKQEVEKLNELEKKYGLEGVPDMPFKNTDQWLNLAFRRVMRYAAENGFDRIAWTTGQQQENRYDLNKQVDSIEYSLREGNIRMYPKGNPTPIIKDFSSPEELEDIVGKELVNKINNNEGYDSNIQGYKVLKGDNLKVGGEGMRSFYDNIVPKVASKLGKPFGAKVENIEIDETGTQQSIPVTESMRESVMQGVPLFRFSGDVKPIAERFDTAKDTESKSDAAYDLVVVAERYFMPNAKTEVVRDKSALVQALKDHGLTEQEVTRSIGNKGIMGVYYDGTVFMNAESADAADEFLSTWIHEQMHAFNEIFPENIVSLEGRIDEIFDEVVPEGYKDLDEGGRVDEVLAYLAQMVVENNPLPNHPIMEEIKPILDKFLNDITDGRYSKAYTDLSNGRQTDADVRDDYKTGIRQVPSTFEGGEGYSEQRKAQRTDRPGNGGISNARGRLTAPAYSGQPIAEYAREVDEYNQRTNIRFRVSLNPGSIPTPPVLHAGMYTYEVADLVKQFKDQTDEVFKDVNLEMAKISNQYTTFIDRARPLEKYQALMAEKGAVMRDDTNAYADYITSASRATHLIQEYNKTKIKPLQETLHKITRSGKLKDLPAYRWNVEDEGTGEVINDKELTDYDRLSLYLQAKDIEEVDSMIAAGNKGIAKRGSEGFEKNVHNAETGKGVKPSEYVAEFETAVGKTAIDDIWAKVRDVNKWALDLQLEYGLITREVYNEYTTGAREYYVPQRGWRERDLSGNQLYYVVGKEETPDNPFNTALVKARGRTTLAGDPLAYMQSIGESSVMAALKNRTKQKFLKFAEDNADFARVHGFFAFKNVFYVNTGKLDADGHAIYERTYEPPSKEQLDEDKVTLKKIKEVRESRIQALQNYVTKKLTKDQYERLLLRLEKKESDLLNSVHVKYADSEASRIAQVTAKERKQHTVTVLREGKEYEIIFTQNYDGERMANNLNRNFAKDTDNELRFMQEVHENVRKGTRFMSAMMTQYNPAFAIKNSIRDFGIGSISNLTEFGPAYQLQFMYNIGASQKAVWKYVAADQWGGKNEYTSGYYGKMLKEFFEDGSATGWSFLKDIDQLRTDMKRAITPTKKDVVLHGQFGLENAFGLRQSFGMLTEVSELTTRFAEYITSREQKNPDGSPKYTRQECAMHAKEISVNFDRKGNQKFFGTLFSFFNASIQGTNKLFRLIRNPKVRNKMIGVSATLMAGGLLQALLMPDPDDDDERLFTEWELMNNICIGKLKMPLPQGLRAFWGMGAQMGMAARGTKSIAECLLDGTNYFFGELIPEQLVFWANGLDIDEKTGNLSYDATLAVRGAIPTTLQPLYDVWQNTNFMGGTSYRTEFTNAMKDTKAERTMGKRNVSEGAQWFSDMMWLLGGGDLADSSRLKKGDTGVVAGIFDWNPSAVETLTRGYAAGTGKFFLDMVTLGRQVFDPELKVDVSTMAVANVLWKQPREYSVLDNKLRQVGVKTDFYKNQFNDIKKNNPDRYERITSFHTRENMMLRRQNPVEFDKMLRKDGTKEQRMFDLIQDAENFKKMVDAGKIQGKAAEQQADVFIDLFRELQ